MVRHGMALPAHCLSTEWRWRLPVTWKMEDMTYHANQDAFIWHPEDLEAPEVFVGATARLPDGRTETLYPIGTGGWCWQMVPGEPGDGGNAQEIGRSSQHEQSSAI